MEILFASSRLRKRCTGEKEMIKAWGPERARILGRRLDQLRAASDLGVMRTLPGRTHELKGDRKGQLSIDLDGPYRLLFEPAEDAVARVSKEGLDWSAVRAIRILGVEDTHG